MAHIDRRRFITKLTHSRVSHVILFLLMTLFVYSAVGAYRKSRIANDRMSASLSELIELEDQKSRLSTELENSNTDFGREKALREKFNVVKEGEQVIVIVNDKDLGKVSTDTEKKGFFEKIFGKREDMVQ